jgi:predicted CXXCH cytochrome family protein
MKSSTIFKTIIISIFITCFHYGSQAQDKEKQSCVTAKCHVNIGKAKFVHGPVAVGECSTCHQLLPDEKHKFKPDKSIGDLCYSCHDPFEKKAIMHSPVAKGECTGCHDPHHSDRKYQLKKSSVSELCFTCHKSDLIKKKYAHGPAANGECDACHTPHSSDKPKLLSKATNELCFECHTDFQENFATAKHIHKPATENCAGCHNPHSGDSKFMLAKDIPEQCFTCHPNIQETITKATVKHKALDNERKCLACHSPHEAQHIKQLKDEPMALCLNCHDKNFEQQNASKLSDMKDWFDKNSDHHGPIRDRDCSGCHEVHGSNNFRLLSQSYPSEFYTSFSNEKYDLCFNCHQPTLVQDAKTTTLTNFRNGDVNMHYLHVNKKVKGRTCRACHETHASNNARHIRESVPFGQWMLPIKFEEAPNGGKCSPGCHAPKEYSRKISETMNQR